MTRRQRGWIWLATICGGVTLYQGVGATTGYLPLYGGVIGGDRGTSCGRFAANGLSSSIDFCFLLDCENGFFGGLVDPCASYGVTADGLLTDCVNVTGPITTGTDTTGTGTTTTTTTTTGTGTGTNTNGFLAGGT